MPRPAETLYPWFAICDRICIDSTGLGIGWADDAQDKFGEHRVEAVNFSSQVKEALAYPLKGAMEDRKLRIPDDPVIRSDLRKIQKVTTLALAIHAASDPSAPIEYQSDGPRAAVSETEGFLHG